MLTLQHAYLVAAPQSSVKETTLHPWWFPEVSFSYVDEAQAETLDTDARLTLRRLGYQCDDGYRYALLCTVWFDDKPVMIIQEAGRSGQDHRKRWVTDAVQYRELCAYLQRVLSDDMSPDDLTDPNTEVFPESLFCFYGQDFGEAYGIAPEPRVPGFMLVQNGRNEEQIIPDTNPEHVIVCMKNSVKHIPDYVRREECVLKKVGPITAEELARNTRVQEVSAEQGYHQLYWYEESPMPRDVPVWPV